MPLIGFGEFEADLETGELLKQGERIPLEAKPFQILATLLHRPGQLVTREELRRRLWPSGTYVDFGRSLNIAVVKLRHALSDTAEKPRYVETLPKRGYRLIALPEARSRRQSVSVKIQEDGGRKIIRLGILPFEDFSGTDQPGRFSEVLIDGIISRLGQLYPRQLGILARIGNLQCAAAAKNVSQISRDWHVDHLLGGTVRAADGQIRITARLTLARDQTLLWSESFHHKTTDPIEVQSEVAASIARSLGSELLSFQTASPGPRAVDDSAPRRDAYLEFLKGQHCASTRVPDGFRKSIRYFARAIALDSKHAAAYSGLAKSMACLGAVFAGGPPKDYYPEAKKAALRAIEINDKLSDGHTSIASVKFFYEWDWAGAERSLCRAIELDPGDSMAHQIYSRYLSSMRRPQEAIDKAKRTCELEPLSAQSYFLLGEAHYFAHQFDEALEAYKSALDLDEAHGPAMMGAGNVYSRQLKFDEALSYLEKGSAAHPENRNILASLGAAYGRAGKLDDAKAILARLKSACREHYVSPFYFALVTAGLGRKEKALAFLNQAYQESSPLLAQFLLPEDPRFDLLRDDSGFRRLIERVRDSGSRMRAKIT